MVPESDRAAVLDEVITDLEKRGWQQTPGDIGHVLFDPRPGRSRPVRRAAPRLFALLPLGSYGGILKKGLTALPGDVGCHERRLSIAQPLHARAT